MRVLYVSKALTVMAYREKLRALAEQVDISAVIPQRWGGTVVPPSETNAPPIHQLRAWFHGHNHFHLYRGLDAIVRVTQPDLVHVDEEPYSAVSSQLLYLCRQRRIPALFFAWQNLHKRLPPPFGRLRKYVFNGAAGGIAGTDRAAAVLRGWGYRGRLAVIPQFGVDPDRFKPDASARARIRQQLRIDAGRIVIGFGGRLVPEKGVHLLIDALAQLPDAHLVIIGCGPEQDRLERMAQERGVAPRIYFAGAVDSTRMHTWLAALDVLVLPSLTTSSWAEQFGRILVEAMACEVAVVGSRSGEIAEVIGDAGLIFEENSVADLTRALRGLSDDPQLRRQLAARGRQRVLEHYTQTEIAGRTVAFYRQVLAQ